MSSSESLATIVVSTDSPSVKFKIVPDGVVKVGASGPCTVRENVLSTLSVPSFSTLAIITKDNTIYLQENTALGIISQPETGGTIDVVCSYEEVS